tara:strand:+ start:53 stop:421 length:369 start_codon:yes stop_codon:yes gene_type:complete
MHQVAQVRARYSDLVKLLGEPDFVREGTYSNPTERDLEHCLDSKVSVMWGMDYEGKKEVLEKYKRWGFAVNDWKEETTPKGLYMWSIRGEDEQAMYKFERMTGLRNHTFPFFWKREDVKENI